MPSNRNFTAYRRLTEKVLGRSINVLIFTRLRFLERNCRMLAAKCHVSAGDDNENVMISLETFSSLYQDNEER